MVEPNVEHRRDPSPNSEYPEEDLVHHLNFITACYLTHTGLIGGIDAIERNNWELLLYREGLDNCADLDDKAVKTYYKDALVTYFESDMVWTPVDEFGEEDPDLFEGFARLELSHTAEEEMVIVTRAGRLTEVSLTHERGWPRKRVSLRVDSITEYQEQALMWVVRNFTGEADEYEYQSV